MTTAVKERGTSRDFDFCGQAFSGDNGEAWETNWVMESSRRLEAAA